MGDRSQRAPVESGMIRQFFYVRGFVMRRRLLLLSGLVVVGLALGACADGEDESDPMMGTKQRNNITSLALAATGSTGDGQSIATKTAYATCLETGVYELSNEERDLEEALYDFTWNRRIEQDSLRAGLAEAGVPAADIEALFTRCAESSGFAPQPTTSAAPATTQPATTAAQASFPDLLLALVEASTDGMVPADKQVCYRDALLAALPLGENTVIPAPASITKDTLQQVLAGLGISVQQQGELLGNCMMSA